MTQTPHIANKLATRLDMGVADSVALSADSFADNLALCSTEALHGVFGSEARFVPLEMGNATMGWLDAGPLTDNWVIRVVLLGLFVCYAATMIIYGGHIKGMWKIVEGHNLGIKVADELSYLFIRAMLTLSAVGVVAIALGAVKALEMSGAVDIKGVSPQWSAPMIMGAIVCAEGVAWLLTGAMCRLVGRDEVGRGLSIMSCAIMGLVATVATPLVLLFVINNGLSAQIVGFAIALVVILAAIAYVVKSFIFFVEQKISILLWFLYLCTVVLIPLGVVVTTIVRNSSI